MTTLEEVCELYETYKTVSPRDASMLMVSHCLLDLAKEVSDSVDRLPASGWDLPIGPEGAVKVWVEGYVNTKEN